MDVIYMKFLLWQRRKKHGSIERTGAVPNDRMQSFVVTGEGKKYSIYD